MDHNMKLKRSENDHALTLTIPSSDDNEQTIKLTRNKNYHTLTLTTPVAVGGGSEPGDYDGLINKPKINGVTLQGNLTWKDLGLPEYEDIPMYPLSNEELEEITT